MEEKKELKESELAKLSGGVDVDTSVHTMMACDLVTCGYKIEWVGNYLNQIVECPNCHEKSFKGLYLIQQNN